MKSLACLLVMMVVVGCVPRYQNSLMVNKVDDLLGSIHVIELRAEVLLDDEWVGIKQKGGTSFAIEGGYLIALSHATRIPDVQIWGTTLVYNKVRNRTYWIGDKQIELLGRIDDVSLFKTPWMENSPFVLGSDPVVGTDLVVLGNSMLNGINIKTGIVSMLDTGKFELDDCFTHTVPLNAGDSGSPILAIRGASYEVVGIANAGTSAQGYNFGIYISRVKEVLDELS